MLKELLEKKQKLINNILHDYIADCSGYEKIIYESMNYSLFAGGKRLRPILLLAANELVGGKEEETYPFAAAIEMIHTYSLIHDDLPAMDNDDYRRGKLTNHKVYGEALAVLAGDALLNNAYEIMLEACAKDNKMSKVNAAKTIANCAGVKGMIGGQVVDIISENRQVNEQELMYIHEHKTAALIKAPLIAGAQLGGATQQQIELLNKFGYYLGMAFQVQDDILDVTSTREVLGKNVQSDQKNNKKTYVSMLGLRKAKDYVTEQSLNAIDCLNKFSTTNNEFLILLTKHLIDRNN